MMVDELGRCIDVEAQYISMHCEATRGSRDLCLEMPKNMHKIQRQRRHSIIKHGRSGRMQADRALVVSAGED